MSNAKVDTHIQQASNANMDMIVQQAFEQANQAAKRQLAEQGGDRGACGFAWVNVKPGTSKLARYLKEHHGARKHYGSTGLVVWNPSKVCVQSVDVLEAGAFEFAKVLQQAFPELTIHANSRLD